MSVETEELIASHATAVLREGTNTLNTLERRKILGQILVATFDIPSDCSSVSLEIIQRLACEDLRPTDGITLHGEVDGVRTMGLWRREQ